MKTREEILAILSRLPPPKVGTITDKLGQGNAAIDMADDVFSITKPEYMLEIGTHKGGSSTVWLCRSDTRLLSIDIGQDWVTEAEHKEMEAVLKAEFGDRFIFIRGDSISQQVFDRINGIPFGLLFVDGNHTYPYAKMDIELGLRLGIKYILIDDYTTCSDIRQAAADTGLIHIKTYDAVHNPANIGLALFMNPNFKQTEFNPLDFEQAK